MGSKGKLLPEYSRALKFLDKVLNNLETSRVDDISEDIWIEGSVMMFKEQFSARHIPSGNNWRWNQTKSRKTAILQEKNVVVNFFKLSTRKRKNGSSSAIPGFKMWQFEIKFRPNNDITFVVWCEKGIPIGNESESETSQGNENGTYSPEEVEMLELISHCDSYKNDPMYSWPSNNSFENLLCL